MKSFTMTSAEFTAKVNSLFEKYLTVLSDSDSDFDTESLRQIWLSKNIQSKIFSVEEKKKSKKKKDKNAPKKGKTAFILWSNNERVKIANEIEQGIIEKIGNKEMISVLATRWASFKENGGDISKYQEMALKDKERYEKEKEEYSSGASDDEEDGNKKKKTKKNTSGLKRNKSAYLFYTSDKEVRSELKTRRPELANNETIKVLAEQWKSLNSEEAQKYHDMATEDKLRYDAERPDKPIKEKKPKKVVEEVVEGESEAIPVEDPDATQLYEAPIQEEVLVDEEEEEVIKKKKRKSKKKIVDSDNEDEEEVIKKKKKNKRKVVDDSDDE